MQRVILVVGMGLAVLGCGRVLGLSDSTFDRDSGSDACVQSSCGGTGNLGGTNVGGASGSTGSVGGGGADAGGHPNGGVAGAFNPGELLYLKADQPVAYAQFGLEIAFDGDTMAVGAPFEGDGTRSGPGAVYVFVRDGSTWRQEQRIPAPPGNQGDYFGMGLSLLGDTLAVGAPHYALDSDGVGAVTVFTRSSGVWSPEQDLQDGDQAPFDAFGVEVLLTGPDTLLAAFTLEAGPVSTATNSGTVHRFTRTGGRWSDAGYFKAPVPSGSALFGRHMVTDGTRLIVGAPGGTDFYGSAFVYEGSGVTWSYVTQLDGPTLTDYFGSGVALDGNSLVVGAIWEWGQDPSQSLGSGSAFLYDYGSWQTPAYLKAKTPQAGSQFGAPLHLSGDTLFVGAYREAVSGNDLVGAVHVLGRTGGIWQEQSVILAPNADAGDVFGVALAGDAHTLAIGAFYESGDGSDPANNGAYRSGAVYLMQY